MKIKARFKCPMPTRKEYVTMEKCLKCVCYHGIDKNASGFLELNCQFDKVQAKREGYFESY